MEEKIKYLEFIQNIITRMNTNSFQIKGMSVTITAALLALFITSTNIFFASIIYFSLFIFWGLDAYYLSVEKGYVNLYDKVRKLDKSKVNFDLKLTKNEISGKDSWKYTLTNKTIYPLYLIQAIISLALLLIFKSLS